MLELGHESSLKKAQWQISAEVCVERLSGFSKIVFQYFLICEWLVSSPGFDICAEI